MADPIPQNPYAHLDYDDQPPRWVVEFFWPDGKAPIGKVVEALPNGEPHIIMRELNLEEGFVRGLARSRTIDTWQVAERLGPQYLEQMHGVKPELRAVRANEGEAIAEQVLKHIPEAERAGVRAAALAKDTSALMHLGGKLSSKLPIIGVGFAAASVAYVLFRADQAHAEGRIDDKQYSAIIAGGATYTASSAFVIGGFAGEEGVEASLKALHVPPDLRFGTTRDALFSVLDDAGTALMYQQRVNAVPQSMVDRFLSLTLPEAYVLDSQPLLKQFVETKARINRESEEGVVEISSMVGKLGADAITRRFPTEQETKKELELAARKYIAGTGEADAVFIATDAFTILEDHGWAPLIENPHTADGKIDFNELWGTLGRLGVKRDEVDANKDGLWTADEIELKLTPLLAANNKDSGPKIG